MARTGEPKENSQISGGDSNNGSNNNSTGAPKPTSTSTTLPANPNDHEDTDFDPATETVDEIDDERTLEEEEALAGDNTVAVQNELDDLRKESEMPIEELLARYRRAPEGGQGEDEEEEEEDEEDEDEEMDDEDEEMVDEEEED